MADLRQTEISIIEFLPNDIISLDEEKFCKYLSNNDFKLLVQLARSNSNKIWLLPELLYPVQIEPIKKCWFRNKDWSHYSIINKEGAHRISFEIFINNLKSSNEICHNCDRKGCINPWHLFQGKHSDNMKDSRNKGNRFNMTGIYNDK